MKADKCSHIYIYIVNIHCRCCLRTLVLHAIPFWIPEHTLNRSKHWVNNNRFLSDLHSEDRRTFQWNTGHICSLSWGCLPNCYLHKKKGSCTLSPTLTFFPDKKHHLYLCKNDFSAPLKAEEKFYFNYAAPSISLLSL